MSHPVNLQQEMLRGKMHILPGSSQEDGRSPVRPGLRCAWGGYFWVLRLCWHSLMLKETPVPQCHLPSTQGFPQSTQWGWRNIMPLPFLGVGWQHLSQDLGKASSAGSALSISAHPFLFNKHFWVVLSSSSPYRAPISMPLKDGCGSPCLPKLSHLGFPSPERTAC